MRLGIIDLMFVRLLKGPLALWNWKAVGFLRLAPSLIVWYDVILHYVCYQLLLAFLFMRHRKHTGRINTILHTKDQ